jgi:uncharacterized membrane protein YjfL (UPF0719 family)
MNQLGIEAAPVLLALAHVVLGIVVLIAAKLLKDRLSPYRVDQELTSHDNLAFGFAIAGYYAATVIIYLGVAGSRVLPLDSGSTAVLQALGLDLVWAIGGVIALMASRGVMDRALMPGCSASAEIIHNRNVATGIVECGVYLATGLVLCGALRGPGGSPLTALVFFLLSQIVLLGFGYAYRKWAGYDVAGEIQRGNSAAGTAFSLTLVAISLLMFKATSGEFIGWGVNLTFFALDAVVGFVLLMALRWVTDAALLPNARIGEEIVRDRNVNVGLLEGVIATGIASIILIVF